MRPSSVETSEPAWVNRKMLSMNSSTSWLATSRKYSAMVSGQTHPHPDAGRLVHLPEHQRGVLDHARLGHLRDQVVALAGALAHAGEHRSATEVLRHAGDHLLDEHR